eukprot:NODE_193_length_15440_cov_0.478587.p1 type:complete len:949 gc:universal NODE_193_length_15440_cov_0.478587:4752-7598(+)
MKNIPISLVIKGKENAMSTTKYKVYNIFIKFFWEQFSNYANLFFFITALIQQIPDVSPLSPWATLVPLTFVIFVSFIKEMVEDYKRYTFDKSENVKMQLVVTQSDTLIDHNKTSRCKRMELSAGNIVKVLENESIPADIIILCASDAEAFVDTMALDGETNLKCKSTLLRTNQLCKINSIECEVESPNPNIDGFNGKLTANKKVFNLSLCNFIPRGCTLKNTKYIYGLVVYTGNNSKIILNSQETPIKTSKVMKSTNNYLIVLILLLGLMALISAVGQFPFQSSYTINNKTALQMFKDFLTFIVLLNNIIPISLIVTVEVVKTFLALFINNDIKMTANVKRSSLVEELGQIEYIFSDKTGTLTQNVMELQQITIVDQTYSNDNHFGGIVMNKSLESFIFLVILSACHTVVVVNDNEYQASSPDELALVNASKLMGFELLSRTMNTVTIRHHHDELVIEILHIIEFTSDRKRMTMLCKVKEDYYVLCKGADSVILPLCNSNNKINEQLDVYSNEGLRTLCCAYRPISKSNSLNWTTCHKSATTLDEKSRLERELESNLTILGCTGIEDKLQDSVSETIELLRHANIKLWVLTGDKLETAINIGYSCKVLTHAMELLIFNFEDEDTFKHNLQKYHAMFKYKKPNFNLDTTRFQKLKNFFVGVSQDTFDYTSQGNPLALVITGQSLKYAMKNQEQFLKLACLCKTVICCRVSPLQKSEVVGLVKRYLNKITLAIGDGANDVSMIQEAHIGIGIMGKEGSQASRTSDISISEFKALGQLLLVHGVWNHHRISKLVLFFFYKNIALFLTQFWFACTNYFSGQSIYESWIASLYNVLFTAFQPMYIGLFEQIVSISIIYKYPQLYKSGQMGTFFSPKVFWSYIFNAIFHSVTSFFIIYAVYDADTEYNGNTSGLYMIGVVMYTSLLLTVNLKAAIIVKYFNINAVGGIGYFMCH